MAHNQRWNARYVAFYDAYYQELLAALVIERWQRIDLFISLLVAITASGSAISGAAWWSLTPWKWAWTTLAAIASLGAIFHTTARVGLHLQRQAECRRDFSLLRSKLQLILFRMTSDGDSEALESEFVDLNGKLAESTAKLEPDIAATLSLREQAQDNLEVVLKKLGVTQTGFTEIEGGGQIS